MERTGGVGSTILTSKSLILGIAAAAGVGCLAFYAWNCWPSAGFASNDKKRSQMGQNQGAQLAVPFYRNGQGYSPVDGGPTANEDWSITVNPHEEAEMQKLIRSSTQAPGVNGSDANLQKDHFRFKRVIFQSRTEETDATPLAQSPSGNASSPESRAPIVTTQPTSSSSSTAPIVLTNLRLADKLKGFSNEEYQNTLQGTLNRLYGSTKILTVDEAKCLTLLLQQQSPDTLLKTLTTMSNLAAFTVNQDLLREQGAVELLVKLLNDSSLTDSTQVMLVQCIGNMAVNQTNNRLLQCCIPRIVEHLLSTNNSELQRVMCVQALTNLSVNADSNDAAVYSPILPVLYQRLWSPTGVNVPALRLLVNLSCVPSVIPYVMATEAQRDLWEMINDVSAPTDVLVRATTFLFYLASTVDTLSLNEEEVRSKADELHSNYETSTFNRLFCGQGLRQFREAVERLRNHENEEVRQRTARISTHLASIAGSSDSL